MGEVLILAKETGEITHGGDRKSKSSDSILKLSDVGVTLNQSSTAQQLAKLSEEVFEQRIEATKVTNQRLTTGRVLVQPEVRADRKMGEVLILAKETGEIKQGGNRASFPEGNLKLSDVGISGKQSHVTHQTERRAGTEHQPPTPATDRRPVPIRTC